MVPCHAVDGPGVTLLEAQNVVAIGRSGLEQSRQKRVLQSSATDPVIKDVAFPPTACSAGRWTRQMSGDMDIIGPSTRCETSCSLGCMSCATIGSIGLPSKALRPDEFDGRSLMRDGSAIPAPYSGNSDLHPRIRSKDNVKTDSDSCRRP